MFNSKEQLPYFIGKFLDVWSTNRFSEYFHNSMKVTQGNDKVCKACYLIQMENVFSSLVSGLIISCVLPESERKHVTIKD